jgi:hypothetical protein
VEDRGRGRVDESAQDSEGKDGTVALGKGVNDHVRRIEEIFERDVVGAGHFAGIWPERIGAAPDDHGSDDETGAGWEVIQTTQDLVEGQLQADLFMKLAESRDLGRLSKIEAATRESPLATVLSQARRPAGEDDGSPSRRVGDDDKGYGGGPAVCRRHASPFEASEMIPQSGAEGFVEGRRGHAVKNTERNLAEGLSLR